MEVIGIPLQYNVFAAPIVTTLVVQSTVAVTAVVDVFIDVAVAAVTVFLTNVVAADVVATDVVVTDVVITDVVVVVAQGSFERWFQFPGSFGMVLQ